MPPKEAMSRDRITTYVGRFLFAVFIVALACVLIGMAVMLAAFLLQAIVYNRDMPEAL